MKIKNADYRDLLVGAEDVCHGVSPNGNTCITIIMACQAQFLCYIIAGMRFLIALSILAILQATPMVPRKAPQKTSPSTEDVQSKANGNKRITTPPPIEDAEPSPTKVKDGQQITSSDKQEHVIVERLPDKDIWDKAYILLTGVLVLIGALSFAAIWFQAVQTKKATVAMERNTEAFVHSQRPIIACDPHSDSGVGWHPIFDLISNNRMRLDLFNRGETNAFHCHSETWIELVPHVPSDNFSSMEDFTFTKKAVYFAPKHAFRIYPNHGPVVINIPVGRDLSVAEHSALKGARLLICVRLRVTYRDAFLSPNDPDRFSDFGFWVMFDGLGTLSKYQDSN